MDILSTQFGRKFKNGELHIMEVEQMKTELMEWLSELEDVGTLNTLMQIKDSMPPDNWYDRLTDAEKKRLEQSHKSVSEGKVFSSEDVWKRYGRKPLRGSSILIFIPMIEDTVKLELIRWILTIDDPEVLKALLKFRDTIPPSEDWYHKLSKSEKARLKKSEADEKAGRVVGNDEVLGKYEAKANAN